MMTLLNATVKLARHPEIKAAYNILTGVPGETVEELKMTRDLIQQLVEEHPNCIVFTPNRYRPLPGTELFRIVERDFNYQSLQLASKIGSISRLKVILLILGIQRE